MTPLRPCPEPDDRVCRSRQPRRTPRATRHPRGQGARGGADRPPGPQERRSSPTSSSRSRQLPLEQRRPTAPAVNQLKCRPTASWSPNAGRRSTPSAMARPRRRRPHHAGPASLGRRRAPGHQGRRRDRRDLPRASASPSRSGPRWRPSGTTSSRSTSRRTTRRWTCTTRSTSTRRRRRESPAAACCSAPIRRRCRSGRCCSRRRRSGWSFRAWSTATMRSIRRTRPPSRRSRASRWTRESRSWTSRRR